MPVPAPTVEVAARRRWTRSAVHVPVVLELETVTAAATCASAVDVAFTTPANRLRSSRPPMPRSSSVCSVTSSSAGVLSLSATARTVMFSPRSVAPSTETVGVASMLS